MEQDQHGPRTTWSVWQTLNPKQAKSVQKAKVAGHGYLGATMGIIKYGGLNRDNCWGYKGIMEKKMETIHYLDALVLPCLDLA